MAEQKEKWGNDVGAGAGEAFSKGSNTGTEYGFQERPAHEYNPQGTHGVNGTPVQDKGETYIGPTTNPSKVD